MSMQVYVHVDQAESVRRGKSAPRRLALVTVNPEAMPDEARDLLASRLAMKSEKELGVGSSYQDNLPCVVSRPGHNSLLTVPEPTPEGLIESLRAAVARNAEEDRKKAEEAAAERAKRRERTLAVLAQRKTREAIARGVQVGVRNGEIFVAPVEYLPGGHQHDTWASYQRVYRDWPYNYDGEVAESPEARAWQKELDAENQRRQLAAIEEAKLRVLAALEEDTQKALAEAQAENERLVWINQHGSERLKRMLQEGIECDATYRDERLSLERPGWAWTKPARGEYDDPRNPPLEAFKLLDEARKLAPDAKLVYWQVENDPEDYYDDDRDKYAWTGYVAVAEYLDGREIVFGLPQEYHG